MGALESFLLVFTPLFVIIGPFGAVPAFLSLTDAFRKNRVKIALRVTLTAFIILLFFGITGIELFHLLGVTAAAFRIAGGIILLRLALEMMKGETRVLHSSHYAAEDISVIPLAIPLLSGPGAITTMVILTNDHPDYLVYEALVVCMLLTFVILASSRWLLKVIKERGLRVLTRLFGIILAAESVQFVLTGARLAITDWGFIKP